MQDSVRKVTGTDEVTEKAALSLVFFYLKIKYSRISFSRQAVLALSSCYLTDKLKTRRRLWRLPSLVLCSHKHTCTRLLHVCLASTVWRQTDSRLLMQCNWTFEAFFIVVMLKKQDVFLHQPWLDATSL